MRRNSCGRACHAIGFLGCHEDATASDRKPLVSPVQLELRVIGEISEMQRTPRRTYSNASTGVSQAMKFPDNLPSATRLPGGSRC